MHKPLSRRTLLQGSVLTLAQATSNFAIAKAELTPYAFGAKGDGSDDTAAFNLAVREAVAQRRPLMIPRGDFRLVPPVSRSWNIRNSPEGPAVHVCVKLASGLSVIGRGGRIVTSSPESFRGDERVFLFGSDFATRQGALDGIIFEDLEVDFTNSFGKIVPYTYAFGLVGTDNFQQKNITLHSSGRRAGRGLFFENGRARRQTGCHHINIIQGHYIKYEHGPVIRDVAFEGLNEGMDWDGPCWGVDARNLRFKNMRGEGQCIDTAGGADWNIEDVTAENTGSVFFIYAKSRSWQTYAEWIANPGVHNPDCVIAERMRFSNIHGRRAGRRRGEETFRVSNYRAGRMAHFVEDMRPSRNITIEDVSIDGGYAASVNECQNLQMHRVRLRSMATPDTETGAALYLRQSTATPRILQSSELSGVVSDLTIEGSQGIGLSVTAPSDLTLSNIQVDGYNLQNGQNTRAGIEIRELGRKPGTLRLENVSVGGGVGTGLTDIAIEDPIARMAPHRLVMSGPIQGTTPGAAMAIPGR